MVKRGQVTIFVIVAVVVIGLILIFFLIKSSNDENREEIVSPEIRPIYDFVKNCIEEVGEQAIDYISLTGGYYRPPDYFINEGVAIYLYNGENYMPSKDRVEEEISNYINERLSLCIRNFEDFEDFKVSQERINTTTKIIPNKVIFEILYLLSITKGEETFYINNFEIEVSGRLGVVYDVVYNYMQEQMDDPKSICISCLYNLSVENDLYVDIYDYDNETVIFRVIDENSTVNNQDLTFNFVNKYGF